LQFVNRHIHFTHASVTWTGLVITGKTPVVIPANLLAAKSRTSKNTATVSHSNLCAFLSHLQNTAADQMSDVSRLCNGLNIRRPKSKANIINESRVKSCLAKFDNGSYSRLQFLCAVSHSIGAHTAALQPADSDGDDDGDDNQSMAVTPTTTSTAPHTAADAAADITMRSVFRGIARGVRAGTFDARGLTCIT